VIGSDLIKQPHYYGLGTKSLPYATREDKPQESPEEESPQTTRRSEEDEPIATQEQQTKVGQLAYQFHDTSLERSLLEETARLHGDQVAHQIYQRMATEATTITEQAQQPIQWTYQAAPLVQQPQWQPPYQPAPQQPPQQPGGGGGPPGGGGGPPGGGGLQYILPVPPQQPPTTSTTAVQRKLRQIGRERTRPIYWR